MVNILDNLRAGYGVLCERVRIALRTQVGDENRLQHQIGEVGHFANAIEIVCRYHSHLGFPLNQAHSMQMLYLPKS